MSQPARRQRLLDALNHRQPDRVPVDFGGTAVTGMHVSCVAALREHYGLPKRPVKVHEPYQMLGWLDDDLKQALAIDVEGIPGRYTIFGFPNENWQPWRTPWGQEVLVSEFFRTKTEANGDVFIYPVGDTSVPPSGHMPAGSYFFDSIIRQEPLDEEHLNPADNLEEFGPLSEDDLTWIQLQVATAQTCGRGIIAGTPGTGLGDIALVPGPFLRRPKGIRDVAGWYMATAVHRDYLHRVFARQAEIALANLERLHKVIGNGVDAVFVCGTDFGTQTGQFCSPATFRDLYLPYYKQTNAWIHEHTAWKTFKHSCGAVVPLIPLIIEAGFDILNPVQCSATGMDPATLKAAYGDRLVFWGGGVDTQRTLPFGTPEQVKREVTERLRLFSPGGGFVFDAIHNVQANTPVANIVAMFDAIRAFNGG